MLEDLFWESSFSSYTQDDYVNILGDVADYTTLTKQELLFNQFNRSELAEAKLKNTPFLRDLVFATNLNTLPLYAEESYTDVNLSPLKDFSLYDYSTDFDSTYDAYANIKFLNYTYHSNYVNTLNTFKLGNQPLSYISVLNLFRANYEENVFAYGNYSDVYADTVDYVDLAINNEFRASNPVKLRSTAKNSIVTFNALQKVFRPRFDEGRSNVRFSDLSNSYVKYPYLSDGRVPYESLLGKNKESFFNINTYKSTLSANYSNLSPVFESLNVYFSNLPFLNAMQSDAVRYLWFD